MKYIDEYRDQEKIEKLSRKIAQIVTRPWKIMEVCGGQTHTIVRYNLNKLLPKRIELLHGPGCPVCVTPLAIIDQAIELATKKEVILCSYGDMLRVPGSKKNLLAIKAEGGDVRVIYSPIDSLKIALANPQKQIVFLAIGFETTAPANAQAIIQAKRIGLKNFSVICAQVLVAPAIELILNSPDCPVNGFLAAGHVCTITGFADYLPLAEKYHIPFVVTGFEPLDIMQGIFICLEMLEKKQFSVKNQYQRSASFSGNLPAKEVLSEVFQKQNLEWRGIGEIKESGLCLKEKYAFFDASRRFTIKQKEISANHECISNLILQGKKKPKDCPKFAKNCNPEQPLGATMVSSEGACAAYYHYQKD